MMPPGTTLVVQGVQTHFHTFIPVPFNVKQGNALDWTVRNPILKQTFRERNSACDPLIPKQFPHFFPLPQSTSVEEFSDFVVRILRGWSGQPLKRVKEPKLAMLTKLEQSQAISVARCPRGRIRIQPDPRGRWFATMYFTSSCSPTEACHGAHRMSDITLKTQTGRSDASSPRPLVSGYRRPVQDRAPGKASLLALADVSSASSLPAPVCCSAN